MIKKIFILLVMLVSVVVNCYAYTLYGNVTKVSDGDTAKVILDDGSVARIRFACIDAPESKQQFGWESKMALTSLIDNSYVKLDVQNTDMYGRFVCLVTVGNLDVNAYMIKNGFAWHYKAYDKTSLYEYYESLEKSARESEIGLWSYEAPIEPWEYRRLKKKGLL